MDNLINKESVYSSKRLLWAEYTSWLIVISIFTYVSYTSFGYDDEYFNIRVVTENNLRGVIHVIQTSDLHPPFSYIINYVIFKITGNWSLVRLSAVFLFLGSVFYASKKIANSAERIFFVFLLGLSPNLLLWVTGLRWYAYMVPLLILWSILPKTDKWYYWPKFFLFLVLVCFLGYAGFFLAIPYFLYYWINNTQPLRKKIKQIFIAGTVFLILYSYQLYIFLTVHSKINIGDERNRQVFEFKAVLSSVLGSLASNQGIFPLSAAGICSIIGSAIIYTWFLIANRKIREKQWIIFTGGLVLFFITGIAGKVRNLILLEPSRSKLFSYGLANGRKWVIVGFFLIAAGNIIGIYHIIVHRQTTKNAWNIPLKEILSEIQRNEAAQCNEVYFTHHPTFTFYLTNNKKKLISLYSTLYFDSSRISFSYDSLQKKTDQKINFSFIFTYPGQSIPDNVYQRMRQSTKMITADSVKHFLFGRDADYKMKQRFFPAYPEYAVEIIKYYGVQKFDTTALRIWDIGR